MAKKVAVLAVNPVNGYGLFQYLEAFFENGIPFTVYAVADTKEIRTNSGIAITANDVIANLKGHSGEYDALVFSCGDAIPELAKHVSETYNQDMMAVIKEFGDAGKTIAGHCAGALIFDQAGILNGRKVAAHPFIQGAIQGGKATNDPCAVEKNCYTAQTEHTLQNMIPPLIDALK